MKPERERIRAAMAATVRYVEAQTVPISYAVKATSATESYDVIRADLVNRIGEAFMNFVSQAGRVTSFRSAAGKALAEDIPAAFKRGYQDAGGGELESDDDDWVTSKQSEQIAFMADAFEGLKDVRANETATQDYIDQRADLWGGMLDGVYSEGMLRGGKNMMLYFDGDDGAESCATCQRLKEGPPHSAKWVREHDMIPHPGNDVFDCGGWRCQHNWFSVKTHEQVTI
jgi:hypothetical protein